MTGLLHRSCAGNSAQRRPGRNSHRDRLRPRRRRIQRGCGAAHLRGQGSPRGPPADRACRSGGATGRVGGQRPAGGRGARRHLLARPAHPAGSEGRARAGRGHRRSRHRRRSGARAPADHRAADPLRRRVGGAVRQSLRQGQPHHRRARRRRSRRPRRLRPRRRRLPGRAWRAPSSTARSLPRRFCGRAASAARRSASLLDGVLAAADGPSRAPGMLASHYAPTARVVLVDNSASEAPAAAGASPGAWMLDHSDDLVEYARIPLRRCGRRRAWGADHRRRHAAAHGLGHAIRDRLTKAAAVR